MPSTAQPSPSQPRAAVLQSGPWWILGAGSIGCLFAAHLQRAGTEVRLILRDANPCIEQGSAMLLLQGDAAANVEPIAVPAFGVTQVSELQQPLQKILICTKAQQTQAAVAGIENNIAPNALVILLQNGMGVREQLAGSLPQATILHALTTEGVYQSERFHIVHAGHGNTVLGAPLSARQAAPQQQELARAAASELNSELNIDVVDNIGERLWLKLIVNSAINPLTALHQCRNGELPQIAGIDSVIAALCAEACAVANAEGQRFEVAQLIGNVYEVCRVTAANRSSMLQDLTRHRRSEIDFINGYILRSAAQHAIQCPQQQTIFDAIKQREQELGCR